MTTYRSFLVNGLDDKFLVIKGDVTDLAPWEPNLWSETVLLLIDIESQGINTKIKISSLLVLDFKIVDSVHLKVLCNLQILQHAVFPV